MNKVKCQKTEVKNKKMNVQHRTSNIERPIKEFCINPIFANHYAPSPQPSPLRGKGKRVTSTLSLITPVLHHSNLC